MANYKGGYTLIDLKNRNIEDTMSGGSTPVYIPGIYAAIERNYRKRVVITGMKFEDVEYPDFEAHFITGTSGAKHYYEMARFPYSEFNGGSSGESSLDTHMRVYDDDQVVIWSEELDG